MEPDVLVTDDDLAIRRMRDDDTDYGLVAAWRNLPHVRRWWDPDLPLPTLDSVREELQPDTLPDAPSTAAIIELNGEPIGYFQFYRWASYADEAREVGIPFDDRTYGLDIFIGQESQVGKGVGTRVVRLMSDYFIDKLGASSVSLTTDIANHVAQRCYTKAGFAKIKQVLDTDTYRGERVRSWLMVKDPRPRSPLGSTV